MIIPTDNDIYIWQENERYIQSELDMIHVYFVHHEWQNDILYDTSIDKINIEKYVTNIPDSTSISTFKIKV